MTTRRLILASASPRRHELLKALGLDFEIVVADIDESPRRGEPPADMVKRLAIGKAAAVRVGNEVAVIGADTAVVTGKDIFGKPRDEEEAVGMLGQLSGVTHRVLTGVALATENGIATAISSTDVRFREIDPDEARRYWQTGEPRGKAGAYAIQGRGGMFVEAISGSYSGVVGLPIFETAKLLLKAGIDVLPVVRESA
ncbi:MAG: septum formation inhibitor Maf [Gammaproteobacteria bacterium]|nr:septum formation inhibitor Maf [Gammaproteobacteria bacterium]NNC78314.1 septum formation inhibitor Maf [Woeseiaceae bacterium]